MESAYQEMSKELGQAIEPFEFDGEWKRFKSGDGKPLWAIGRSWEYKSNTYYIAYYGDWRQGSRLTWTSYDPKSQTKEFIKSQKEVLEELAAKTKFETQKKNKECIDKWKPKFKSAEKSSVHEYLSKKI